MRESLDSAGIRNQTDKASVFTRTYAQPHDYLRQYERFFEPLRDKPIKLLEIGVGGGESVKTWLDWFSKAAIWGVDIVHDTNPWNTPKGREYSFDGRYRFIQGNQGCNTFWECFKADEGLDWSIILDDGSHLLSDIITTFEALWPHVLSGGLYCVEDLDPDHMRWLAELRDEMQLGTSDIDSIHFSKQLAILRKK